MTYISSTFELIVPWMVTFRGLRWYGGKSEGEMQLGWNRKRAGVRMWSTLASLPPLWNVRYIATVVWWCTCVDGHTDVSMFGSLLHGVGLEPYKWIFIYIDLSNPKNINSLLLVNIVECFFLNFMKTWNCTRINLYLGLIPVFAKQNFSQVNVSQLFNSFCSLQIFVIAFTKNLRMVKSRYLWIRRNYKGRCLFLQSKSSSMLTFYNFPTHSNV